MAETVNTYQINPSSRSVFSAKPKSVKPSKRFVGGRSDLPQKRFSGFKAK